MAHFVELPVTTFQHSAPLPSEDICERWINLDHVIAIDPHLADSTFVTGDLDRSAIFYPCLQLQMSDGESLLVPLGTAGSEAAALQLIGESIRALTNTHAGESLWERFEAQFRN